jgi:hypothetical protein
MRLAVEAEKVIATHTEDGDHRESESNRRLKTLLKLQTILCAEYRYVRHQQWPRSQHLTIIPHQRNAYFAIINLIGPGVFNLVRDHHRQRDGVLEAEAVRIDDIIETIRHVAD